MQEWLDQALILLSASVPVRALVAAIPVAITVAAIAGWRQKVEGAAPIAGWGVLFCLWLVLPWHPAYEELRQSSLVSSILCWCWLLWAWIKHVFGEWPAPIWGHWIVGTLLWMLPVAGCRRVGQRLIRKQYRRASRYPLLPSLPLRKNVAESVPSSFPFPCCQFCECLHVQLICTRPASCPSGGRVRRAGDDGCPSLLCHRLRAGFAAWPDISLSYAGQPVPDAGHGGVIGLCLLLVTICLLLPANRRMARLERSHRSFAIGLQDVAQAYRLAHAADRAGAFALSGEFEAVRARLEHLKNHPDLAHLEPEILQLAAQMSFVTRDLAQTYSDDKVTRARTFLQQRQEEVKATTDRLTIARHTVDELRRWLTDIEAEERKAEQQIKRLEADLRDVLPALGYAMEVEEPRDSTVVQLPKPSK